MAETTFHDINSCTHNAYVETSHKSLPNATCEHKNKKHKNSNNNETSSSDIVNAKVSGDGAFQKGGYS